MSRTRQQHSPVADHSLFVLYRWLAWLVAGVAIIAGRSAPNDVLLLVIVVLANLIATFAAQQYVRVVRKTPALLSLDIVFCAIVLYASGGWAGPFALYSLSGLVLPALLFGWYGGLMSGLVVVSLHLAMLAVNGILPTQLVEQGRQAELTIALVAAPLFGCFFPTVIEIVRRTMAQRQTPPRPGSPLDEPRLGRSDEPDNDRRFVPRTREQERRPQALPELLAPRTTVRTVEPNTEELRRALCMPFTQDQNELPAMIDTLATRFTTQCAIEAQVIRLGRPRPVAHAQQAVLVRLLQESLLNVKQHAHASKVELTLRFDTLSVALLVQDNGVGLLDGTHERPGLHALRAMHYRLAELGGKLDVFETSAGGVTVRATAPLD
ncbi:MAG: histidine kinase [Roseiflexaceae bacterium]|nr:histidine kinase [Roseiflexaceae bacterium]